MPNKIKTKPQDTHRAPDEPTARKLCENLKTRTDDALMFDIYETYKRGDLCYYELNYINHIIYNYQHYNRKRGRNYNAFTNTLKLIKALKDKTASDWIINKLIN